MVLGLVPCIMLAALIQQEIEPLSWSVYLPLLGIVIGSAIWRGRAAVTRRDWRNLTALLGACVVVALAPLLFNASQRNAYDITLRLAPIAAAWTTLVFLLPYADTRPASATPLVAARWQLPVLLITAFALLATTHWLTHGRWVVLVDETLYLLQSRLLRESGFARHIAPGLEPFFTLKQTVLQDGRFYPEYTFGWPAVIAAFDSLGLRWWSGVVMSTAGLWFTYLLVRDLHSPVAGLTATALLATNQIFVLLGASYFSHTATLAVVAAGAWLLIAGERRNESNRRWLWLGAGFLFAFSVAMRPLTGATLTVSVLGWIALRRNYDWRNLAALTLWFGLGALAPIVALLGYNAATTGSPLTFGYQAANGGLHELGFGLRGWVLPDALGRMLPAGKPFMPVDAADHLLLRIHEFAQRALPAYLLAAVAFLAFKFGYSFRWRHILPFLMLPAAYFFYYYTSIRFYVELLPFFYAAIAAVLVHVTQRNPLLGRTVFVTIVSAQLLLTAFNVHSNWSGRQAHHFPMFTAVQQAQQQHGKVVLFVSVPPGNQEVLENLAWFNIEKFPGDVVVARDLGADNRRLLEELPSHVPFRAVRTKAGFELTRLGTARTVAP
jgi:hypothetical protein